MVINNIKAACDSEGEEYNEITNKCELKVSRKLDIDKFIESTTKDNLLNYEIKDPFLNKIENIGCGSITAGVTALSHGITIKGSPAIFQVCKIFMKKIEDVLIRREKQWDF
jgi:hypothetical protein